MIIEGKELNLIFDLNKEQETPVLKNIDIVLKSGEMAGIMGPSGSGKSSLLYLLSGLRKPTTGTVYYDDVDIESIPQPKRNALRKKSFGFIFQRHFLIDYLSILDNVLVSTNMADATSRRKAYNLLDRLGIGHLAAKKPYQLSGGQRQRTAIARALYNDPKVIFADEPTASLDHGNAKDIMEVLGEFKQNAAIMVVTHDRSILGGADKIIELWDGHLK